MFVLRIFIIAATLTVTVAGSVAAQVPRDVLGFAWAYLDEPYRFGGDSRGGLDCAALVRRAFQAVGVDLPRTAREQYELEQKINRKELAPGDLVFFRNTYRRGISHVGIYLGNSRFIHAAKHGVAVASLETRYWSTRFAGARRVATKVSAE